MTREEAIETIKRNCTEGSQLREACAMFIPELKESEDEMHRKWILEYLYDGLRKANEEFKDHFKLAIDWFEKQKECLADDSKTLESEDERIRKEIVDYLNLVGKGDGDYAQPMIDKWIAYLEKQKESLHIHETCKENANSFTDADEDRTINGCLLAANAERRCKRASEELLEELGLADYTKFFYEQGVEKGKKERDKQKEQKESTNSGKPKEWSEEDEKIMQTMIKDGDLKPSEIAWLKSLRPHWKPSEVCYGAKGDPDPAGVWKPSEEQMKALYCALNDAISLYSDKVSPLYEEISRTHFDALESLYNDLKKL